MCHFELADRCARSGQESREIKGEGNASMPVSRYAGALLTWGACLERWLLSVLQEHAHLTRSSSMTASMDSTLASSMTQVICSFLMPKPTGTNFAAQAPFSVSSLYAEPIAVHTFGLKGNPA